MKESLYLISHFNFTLHLFSKTKKSKKYRIIKISKNNKEFKNHCNVKRIVSQLLSYVH